MAQQRGSHIGIVNTTANTQCPDHSFLRIIIGLAWQYLVSVGLSCSPEHTSNDIHVRIFGGELNRVISGRYRFTLPAFRSSAEDGIVARGAVNDIAFCFVADVSFP